MRSFAAHNTFFLANSAQNALHQDLFQLHRPKQHPTAEIKNHIIHETHTQYLTEGLIPHRSIEWQDHSIHISDWWEQKTTHTATENTTIWTLHFGPGIDLEKKDNYHWIIKKEEKEICQIETTIIFESRNDIFSPTYGSKISTKILIASTLVGRKKEQIVIQRIVPN